jgi:hypothetical protein
MTKEAVSTIRSSGCSLGRSMIHESMDLLSAQGHERASTILRAFDDHLRKCSVCLESHPTHYECDVHESYQ